MVLGTPLRNDHRESSVAPLGATSSYGMGNYDKRRLQNH